MKDFSPTALAKRLKGKAVFIGMGNTLKGDDGAGIALLNKLKGKLTADFIDCGTVPENYLGKVVNARAETIVVLDAVELALAPGEVRILEIEDLQETLAATHSMSPALFMRFLRERLEGSDIFMLGIQPASTKLGSGLSTSVEKALVQIEESLLKCMN